MNSEESNFHMRTIAECMASLSETMLSIEKHLTNKQHASTAIKPEKLGRVMIDRRNLTFDISFVEYLNEFEMSGGHTGMVIREAKFLYQTAKIHSFTPFRLILRSNGFGCPIIIIVFYDGHDMVATVSTQELETDKFNRENHQLEVFRSMTLKELDIFDEGYLLEDLSK